jgi:hypothetical protein
MAEKNDKAKNLAVKADDITNGSLKFPQSEKASKKALKKSNL